MDIHKIKQMISEPASKEWFAKHSPKSKAIQKVSMADLKKRHDAKYGVHKEKIDWQKSGKSSEQMDKEENEMRIHSAKKAGKHY